ncbi:MAG: 4Fe-4S binding protein, partial [Planctomycetota bacterium]
MSAIPADMPVRARPDGDGPSGRRKPPAARPNRLARWRAGCLAAVYLLIGLHIAHWKIAGRTLAPLELNEVMYTLELGVITAGFIFMAAAFLSAALFGRFFCSWGCHILALEDLSAWLLKRVGIRPKPVRARLLLLVPPAALFYMFIWPQITRIAQGRSFPGFRLATDSEGWASFVTNDFWRNLPGPGVALLTFAVCGFAIVYFLGSRSFCRYACPYGVVFALGDRVAPLRLKATGDCSKCGRCTAVCQSNLRVHEELAAFGTIVSPSCLKDLDCMSVCPERAIGYGLAKPALFKSFRRAGRKRLRYDYSVGEELLMAATFVATVAIFRGLYGLVPFLMTLGLGCILAWAAVLSLRLARAEHVRLNRFQLKRSGRLTRAGRVAGVVLAVVAVLTGHSAFIRYHEAVGHRAYDRLVHSSHGAALDTEALAVAREHLGRVGRWGLLHPRPLDERIATVHLAAGAPDAAEPSLRRIRRRDPAAAHALV